LLAVAVELQVAKEMKVLAFIPQTVVQAAVAAELLAQILTMILITVPEALAERK
jgi:hypothetical protein